MRRNITMSTIEENEFCIQTHQTSTGQMRSKEMKIQIAPGQSRLFNVLKLLFALSLSLSLSLSLCLLRNNSIGSDSSRVNFDCFNQTYWTSDHQTIVNVE